MQITVIGGGYVGLVSSICFAELGHTVNLVEVDEKKVSKMRSGIAPIYEKGLEELLSSHLGSNFFVSSRYDDLANSEVSLICVGTPQSGDGSSDLSMVQAASKAIGESLKDMGEYHTVAVKSTVPPGTTERLVAPEVLKRSGHTPQEIGFAMTPEFLREGQAIEDFLRPDRIIIGSSDVNAGDLIERTYRGIDAPIIRTGITEAEMIKYSSNAFLAAKISLTNEIGNICKGLGIDTYNVMHGVGMDHRISPYFLSAGAGFGGSCFPKDVRALIHLAEGIGEEPRMLKSIMEINDIQPLKMLDLLERRVGTITGKRIAILGLAFKNDTDDIRESRSIPVISELIKHGAEISAYDPKANSQMGKLFPDINYYGSAAEAIMGADACLIMTEWPEFNRLDGEFDLMRSRVVIEGRRVLSCKKVEGICW